MTTATLTDSQRHFATLAHEDVELLIYDTVHKIRRRHGGDFDDLVGEANLIFSRLCVPGDFDPNRGAKFSTWLRTKVFWGLLSYRRRQIRLSEREQAVDLDEVEVALGVEDRPDRWWLEGDAAELVRMVLESPLELADVLAKSREDAHDRLIGLLLGRGWTWFRITQAFEDVREALR